MISHRSLSDSKSPQVSRTLLCILADRNNAVVWRVFTQPLISKSSCLCTNFLRTVPRAPITIGINVSFMFHSFFGGWGFSSLSRFRYLSFFSLSFNFTLWSAGTVKSRIRHVIFFIDFFKGLVIWSRIDDPFVYQNPRGVCTSHFLWQILGCPYNIRLQGQTSISCTILNGSPCPPNRVESYTLSVLICCIRLLCDW